jgi:hypothetical protein
MAAGEPKKINIRIEEAETKFDTIYNYGILWAVCSIGIGLIFVRDLFKKKPFICLFNKEIPYYQYMKVKLYILSACIAITSGFPTRSEKFDGASAGAMMIILFGTIFIRDYIIDRKQKRNLNM